LIVILTTAALLFGFFGPASFVRALEATSIAWKKARLDERGWATAGEWSALVWAALQLTFWTVAVVGVGACLYLRMQLFDFTPTTSVLFNAWLIGISAFVWLLLARSTVAMGIAWVALFALTHATGYPWIYVALLLVWTAGLARAAWHEFATKPESHA